ncbi:hypothetical protein P3T39_001095 [Kitasatospora sp. GP82]|nr:hypothetical protein [Kitasatospora sp. GP82]
MTGEAVAGVVWWGAAFEGGRQDGEGESGGCHCRADQIGDGVAVPGADDQAAEPGGQGVAQVERADVDCGGQGGRLGGLVEYALLQWRHGGEAERAERRHGHGGRDPVVRGDGPGRGPAQARWATRWNSVRDGATGR